MNKFLTGIVLFVIALAVVSCNKELNVYAPYTSTTIVTALLDPSVDTQYVRLNRTWQGQGSNLDYAMVRDSSEYQWDEFNSIVVQEISEGSVTDTWTLEEIERQDKDVDGIFYGPEYTAYFFVNSGGFDDSKTYKLKVDFKDRLDIEAETNVITASGGSVSTPNESFPENYTIRFADIFGSLTTYKDFSSKWSPYDNAARYDVSLKVYFKERLWQDEAQTVLLEETDRSLNWNLGTVDADSPLSNGKHVLKVNGESFYIYMKNRLEASPFISRELGYYQESDQTTYVFDYVLNIANEDLDLFMEVNEPVTNIIQERPSFTNVANGLGIFGSRVSITLEGVGLKPFSVQELIEGSYTIDLNFCSGDIFSDYWCDL